MSAYMTERQAAAWPDVVARVHRYCPDVRDDLDRWTAVEWQDEVRPGRGHTINATNNDGDHFVQVVMDVYGRASVSVADLDWLHSDENEECACDWCGAERREEEAR